LIVNQQAAAIDDFLTAEDDLTDLEDGQLFKQGHVRKTPGRDRSYVVIGAEGFGDIERPHSDCFDRIDSGLDRFADRDVDAALEDRLRQQHVRTKRQLARADTDLRVGAD